MPPWIGCSRSRPVGATALGCGTRYACAPTHVKARGVSLSGIGCTGGRVRWGLCMRVRSAGASVAALVTIGAIRPVDLDIDHGTNQNIFIGWSRSMSATHLQHPTRQFFCRSWSSECPSVIRVHRRGSLLAISASVASDARRCSRCPAELLPPTPRSSCRPWEERSTWESWHSCRTEASSCGVSRHDERHHVSILAHAALGSRTGNRVEAPGWLDSTERTSQ